MTSLPQKIRQFALEIGFDLVGFTPAEPLSNDEQAFQAWLSAGYAGEMAYMARDPARRANPKQILPEAKTVICLALNYYPGDYPEMNIESERPHINGRISRYAWGKDYHLILEEKLDCLAEYLKQEAGHLVKIKRYVDYGPVLERAYASRAGLGFIGKNTLLITQEFGSWVFLAELITDLELTQDPLSDRPSSQCGSCTLCLEACPTGALVGPFTLDARRCISYLTIENKNEISVNLQTQMGDWVFGCDICQEVCPYNQQIPQTQNTELVQGAGPRLNLEEILSIDEETFKTSYQDTPLLRPKHKGLQRNARIAANNLALIKS
jgi:epoxyqueuosine reductase